MVMHDRFIIEIVDNYIVEEIAEVAIRFGDKD